MEPQIIDYYNEYPHMMKVIEKLNLEYDELYEENQSLKKEIERLRNIYEPKPDLNRLIEFSLRTRKHYDIARVFHFLYKDEFKCVSLNNNKWMYKSGDEWKDCDSELGKHGIQVRIKLNEMRNIYENKLQEYLERFKVLTETNNVNNNADDEEGDLDYEIFIIDMQKERCEDLVDKFKGRMFYSYLLKECAELFYNGD